MQNKLFECLKEADGIYSIKLKGELNIRILFCFENIDKKEKAVLYYCFNEKRKKDYAKGIEKVKERIIEINDKYKGE